MWRHVAVMEVEAGHGLINPALEETLVEEVVVLAHLPLMLPVSQIVHSSQEVKEALVEASRLGAGWTGFGGPVLISLEVLSQKHQIV